MKTNSRKSSIIKTFSLIILFVFTSKANAQCGPAPTGILTPITCYGQTASIDLALNMLGGPYNVQPYLDYQNPGIPIGAYVQMHGAPTYTITNLNAGQYTFYIVDAGHGNCYDSVVVNITQPNILNIATGFGNPYDCNGTVTANFTFAGGTAPYHLQYTQDGTSFNTLTVTSNTTYNSNLNLGAYGFKVTDVNGCIVDQSSTAFGFVAANQSHYYVGFCGVEDSSVTYLTGGNQTLTHNVNTFMQGLGGWFDNMRLKVDYGDGTSITNYNLYTGITNTPIAINHTYSTPGIYKATYTSYNYTNLDSVVIVEFIHNNYSDVWPGDANSDGFANVYDVLNIGIGFGNLGTQRPSANLSWTAQSCPNWGTNLPQGIDMHHADCDGDGGINFSDTTAIIQNYGLSHVMKLSNTVQNNPNDIPLEVNFPAGNYNTGSLVTIPITLGTTSIPANNIYGIAFTLDYPETSVDANNIGVDYTNSWLNSGTGAVYINKNFAAQGKVDIGISRINHANVSGSGTLCELKVITIDNVSGKLNSLINQYYKIENVRLIDFSGNEIPVNIINDTAFIAGSVGLNYNDIVKTINVYPNPAQDKINFNLDLIDSKNASLEIYDILGNRIEQRTLINNTNNVSIDLNLYTSGIYTFKIINQEEQIYTSKFIVSK